MSKLVVYRSDIDFVEIVEERDLIKILKDYIMETGRKEEIPFRIYKLGEEVGIEKYL